MKNYDFNLFYEDEKTVDKYKFPTTYPYQNTILSFLYPDNPYRSLVVCFKVGIGKTYAAACLTHIYLEQGFRTLYLSNSLNSLSNFKIEYKKVVEDNRYKSFTHKLERMTFSKFYYAESIKDYSLIIVDEAHNLREGGVICNKVKSVLKNMVFAKILIMTATPMVDSYNEMEHIVNLTGSRSDVIFTERTVTDVNINYVGENINGNILFLSQMKGLQLKEYNKYKDKIESVFSNLRQLSISSSSVYDINIPIEEQSSKIFKLIKTLKQDKPTVIFCFYINRGINFLVQILESLGYTEYTKKGTKNYAVITGNTSKEQSLKIIEHYNSIININGSVINILLGSIVMSESITLYRTRELHILSPHWNFNQINQSIGRVIRLGSHSFLPPKDCNINIYLHAAYGNSIKESKDINIYDIAFNKQIKINDILHKYQNKKINFIDNEIYIPEPDNNLIFKVNDTIWDLTECFNHNKYKISWCEFNTFKAKGYNLKDNSVVLGKLPEELIIHFPLKEGYSIWRSCIDNKLRISYFNDLDKIKKQRRGKIVFNMNIKEIQQTAKDLSCDPNIPSIITTLAKQNRYFDKQIEIKHDL
nr:helicase [Saccharomycopsis selenospora]